MARGPVSRARTDTVPASVYLTALPSRLMRIWRRCVGSVRSRGSVAPTASERLSPFSVTSASTSPLVAGTWAAAFWQQNSDGYEEGREMLEAAGFSAVTTTLLKYAASDNDRTMLFGAELHIKLD